MIEITQGHLLEIPHLAPWLLDRMWHQDFTVKQLDTRGYRLTALRLIEPDLEDPFDEFEGPDLVVGAEIEEPSGRYRSLGISFFIDDEQPCVDFASSCDCSERFTCKHTALVLETLTTIAGTPSSLIDWIRRLRGTPTG